MIFLLKTRVKFRFGSVLSVSRSALSVVAFITLLSACAFGSHNNREQSDQVEKSASFVSAAGEKISILELDAFVDKQMRELRMPGLSVAVISNGKTVYHSSKGVTNIDTGTPITQDSVFEAASLSKPLFAYFVLKLIDKGILDLDTPLYQYRLMEELEPDQRYRSITTRMALSHQTGFPNWRWFDPAPSGSGIERGTMYMKREPGEFGYSGEGYNYLALVIAALLDTDITTLDEFYQAEVAKPLGMKCSSFVRSECVAEHKVSGHNDNKVKDDGWPRSFPEDTPMTFGAAGRLHTNVLDYAKFLIVLMNEAGLPQWLFDEMFAQQAQIPIDSKTHILTGQTAWGLGLAIKPTPYGVRYEHGGNNGNFQSGMMFYKNKKLGYVFFTNSDKGEEFNRRLELYITGSDATI